jgi:hypothetical protein
MPTESGLRIGACLLAIALFGAGASMRPGFAEDSGAGAPDAKAPEHVAAPAAETPPPDAVDSSIAAPPRRAGAKPSRDANVKIESPMPANLHRKTFSPARPAGQTVRNAVGVTLQKHDSAERHNGANPDRAAVRPGPAIAKTGVTERSTPGGSVERVPVIIKPIVAPPAASHGPINGTTMVHQSASSARIGGPSPVGVGINGTTIRPKH